MKKKVEFIGTSKQISYHEREALIRKLVKDAFSNRYSKLQKKMNLVCDDLYARFVSKYVCYIKKLPKRYHVKSLVMNHTINRSYYSKVGIKNEMSEERLFVNSNSSDTPALDIKEYPEYYKKIEKIDAEYDMILEHEKRVSAKTKAAIYSCKTTKQLFERWPEAYNVYLEINPHVKSAAYLPDIQREDLNKELGL